MQFIALNWLVYNLTNSERALGIMSLATFISFLPASLVGGSLADTYPKRKILLIINSVMIFPPIAIAIVIWLGVIQVWHVILLAFIAGGLGGIMMPTMMSFIVELTGKKELARAVPLNSFMFNLSRLLGPAIGGAIIAKWGEAWAFFINGASYLATVIALGVMVIEPVKTKKITNTVQHLKEGISYISKYGRVKILLSILAVSVFFCFPIITLLPVFAKKVFGQGAREYGFLLSMWSSGAIVGGIVTSSIVGKISKVKLMLIGGFLFPFLLILFSQIGIYSVAVGILFAAGLVYISQFSMLNTLVQLLVKDDFRGRVMSIYTIVFQSSLRFGGFVGAFFAQEFGAPITVTCMALFPILYLTAINILKPNFRKAGEGE